jgi:hypothetical protein
MHRGTISFLLALRLNSLHASLTNNNTTMDNRSDLSTDSNNVPSLMSDISSNSTAAPDQRSGVPSMTEAELKEKEYIRISSMVSTATPTSLPLSSTNSGELPPTIHHSLHRIINDHDVNAPTISLVDLQGLSRDYLKHCVRCLATWFHQHCRRQETEEKKYYWLKWAKVAGEIVQGDFDGVTASALRTLLFHGFVDAKEVNVKDWFGLRQMRRDAGVV